MSELNCLLCGDSFDDVISWIQHIDDVHPDVAKKIKDKWREEGL